MSPFKSLKNLKRAQDGRHHEEGGWEDVNVISEDQQKKKKLQWIQVELKEERSEKETTLKFRRWLWGHHACR